MISSRYYQSWEDYFIQHPELSCQSDELMASVIQKYEDMMFQFVFNLLM